MAHSKLHPDSLLSFVFVQWVGPTNGLARIEIQASKFHKIFLFGHPIASKSPAGVQLILIILQVSYTDGDVMEVLLKHPSLTAVISIFSVF
ncbi:hypothetical protein BTVI_132811 [Pitangus sulphuratus]|nr:hypothetical protein BTVI_132811 [Pitangus sulphuratus]